MSSQEKTALQPYYCCGMRYWREVAFDDKAEVVALMDFEGPSQCLECGARLADFAITEGMHMYYDDKYPEMVVDLVVRRGLMPGRAREILAKRYADAFEVITEASQPDMGECDFAGCVEPAVTVLAHLGIGFCVEHAEDYRRVREARAGRSAS